MIRDLNQMTFQSFGSVLSDRAQADKNNELIVPLSVDASQVDVYRAASPTWLNCSGGKAVLSASTDGESFQDFYLDKRVCVSADVYFALYPFKGEASVTVTRGRVGQCHHCRTGAGDAPVGGGLERLCRGLSVGGQGGGALGGRLSLERQKYRIFDGTQGGYL